MLVSSTAARIAFLEGNLPEAASRAAESLRLARAHGDQGFMTVGLGMLAGAAAASGDLARAARLKGAADFHRLAIGMEMAPPYAQRLGEELEETISKLPDVEAEREAGRRMTLDQAVELALGVTA
jgi:hypothetical protein